MCRRQPPFCATSRVLVLPWHQVRKTPTSPFNLASSAASMWLPLLFYGLCDFLHYSVLHETSFYLLVCFVWIQRYNFAAQLLKVYIDLTLNQAAFYSLVQKRLVKSIVDVSSNKELVSFLIGCNPLQTKYWKLWSVTLKSMVDSSSWKADTSFQCTIPSVIRDSPFGRQFVTG